MSEQALHPVGAIIGHIERHDPRLSDLIDIDAGIEVLAAGFDWSEGPIWVPRQGGYLLFSDIPRNSIFRWQEGAGLSLFMKPSGYTGESPWRPEPGSNGLTLDNQGRLVMCEHGDRRVSRLINEEYCLKETLADNYQGLRLNSPNDLVYHSGGDLYFTDPPYGLPDRFDDPRRELDFCGVYRLDIQGQLTLQTREMTLPNGLAFSPDEKTLYVAQSDPQAALWQAFEVLPGGDLGSCRLFFDATPWADGVPGLPDGLKVDQHGNLFATGPGGVHVFTAEAEHLGVIVTGEANSNCAFGGPDGNELYITADSFLCRLRTKTKAARRAGR
mgnify:CR=1 FL=1